MTKKLSPELQKFIDEWRANGTRGVRISTVPKTLKPGRKLMHNHVMHTVDMPCGMNGFRAWTADKVAKGFVKCPCGWSGLPHYATPEHVKATKGKCATWEQMTHQSI
jgi:hypothetical protein